MTTEMTPHQKMEAKLFETKVRDLPPAVRHIVLKTMTAFRAQKNGDPMSCDYAISDIEEQFEVWQKRAQRGW